jgi:hypothetical protein
VRPAFQKQSALKSDGRTHPDELLRHRDLLKHTYLKHFNLAFITTANIALKMKKEASTFSDSQPLFDIVR